MTEITLERWNLSISTVLLPKRDTLF